MPTPNADLLSLIIQVHDENWEELDLSGMGLTELPIEIGMLTGLKTLILGKEDLGEWKDGEYVPTTIANQLTILPDELLALVNLRSTSVEIHWIERLFSQDYCYTNI